jgi:hypothetical protein
MIDCSDVYGNYFICEECGESMNSFIEINYKYVILDFEIGGLCSETDALMSVGLIL